MISLDQKLGELITEMTPEQLKAYRINSKAGAPIENLIYVAEAAIKELPKTEYIGRTGAQPRICRNDGTSGYAQSDPRAESDRLLTEALAKRDPRFAKAVAVSEQGVASLSESQKKEFDFCKMLGMSEADALKVATSNAITD
jgi:hypothetical protein